MICSIPLARLRLQVAPTFLHRVAQRQEGIVNRARSVNGLKAVLFGQLVERGAHPLLVLDKADIVIRIAQEIHPRFPIVKAARVEHARDQVLDIAAQVQDCVGHQGKTQKRTNPCGSTPRTMERAICE
jgi:hypothetical protein